MVPLNSEPDIPGEGELVGMEMEIGRVQLGGGMGREVDGGCKSVEMRFGDWLTRQWRLMLILPPDL
jgi:hypothetical protein